MLNFNFFFPWMDLISDVIEPYSQWSIYSKRTIGIQCLPLDFIFISVLVVTEWLLSMISMDIRIAIESTNVNPSHFSCQFALKIMMFDTYCTIANFFMDGYMTKIKCLLRSYFSLYNTYLTICRMKSVPWLNMSLSWPNLSLSI